MQPAERAKAATIGEAASQAQYEVLRAGREKVQQSSVRWRRVTDGNPCGFCAMVASRGPVYRSASSAGDGRRYHNRCGCTVEPFEGSPSEWVPSPDEQRFVDAYDAVHRKGMKTEDLAAEIELWLGSPANALSDAGAEAAQAAVRKPGVDLSGIRGAKTPTDVGDELQRILGGRGKVSGFDAGLDVEKVRTAAEQAALMFERYPQVSADVKILPIKNVKVYAQAGARADGTGLDLEISAGKMSKRSKIGDTFANDCRHGHFHADEGVDPIRYVLSHEFGHLVDFAGRGAGVPSATGIRIDVQAIQARLLADEGITNAHGKEAAAWRKKNVSGYGRTNQDELVAEAFADVVINGDKAKPYSRLIHDEYVARMEAMFQ